MKTTRRKFAEGMLIGLAQQVLAKQQPKIVGITGSVGKTTTKEILYAILAQHHSVRRSAGSFNNEIGLPLTILGVDKAPGKSIVRWVSILLTGVRLSYSKSSTYPQILILEMGCDRPGDIKKLAQIAPPDVSIITTVGEAHYEFFSSIDAIEKEKGSLAEHTKASGTVVLNADDERVKRAASRTRARVTYFGFADDADLKASETTMQESTVEGEWGMTWKVTYAGSVVPLFLPGVLGKQQVICAMAATSAALALGENLVDVAAGLRAFVSPPGRMRVLPGIKRTKLIDDSYNASPKSVLAALQVVSEIAVQGKKIVVLGDMLELGSLTEEAHTKVGAFAAGVADELITVGERARIIAEEAKRSGLTDGQVFSFSTADDARIFVQERMEEGDLVLVKGSRGMHLEIVVKEIMAEPQRAFELIVQKK